MTTNPNPAVAADPIEACGSLGLCVKPKGHDGKHSTSVASALALAAITPAPAVPDRDALPVGAYVASALAAANYGGDSGEDVDRFLAELAKRGCEVVRSASDVLGPGLREAKRRLSAAGMHDGKCPEPRRPCTCGVDDAIDARPPTLAHRDDDQPCACDGCMDLLAEDDGVNWFRLPRADRERLRREPVPTADLWDEPWGDL